MKKFACLMLALLIAMPMISVAAPSLPYADVRASDWFYDAVVYSCANGLTAGTSDTTYSPKAAITLKQFTSALMRVSEIGGGQGLPEQVDMLLRGTQEQITRWEMAIILGEYVRHLGLEESGGAFVAANDYAMIAPEARENVALLMETGLIIGDSAGNFNPESYLSRAEAAAIFMRLVEKLENSGLIPPSVMLIDGLRVCDYEWELYFSIFNYQLLSFYHLMGYSESEIRELLRASVNDRIVETKALYNEAVAHNAGSLGTAQPVYADDISGMSQAEADEFLQAMYSTGMTLAEYKRICMEIQIAEAYGISIYNSFVYSTQDLEQFYLDNKEQFDYCTYRVLGFNAYGLDEKETQRYKAAAEEMLGRITDEQSFVQLGAEYAKYASQYSAPAGDYTFRYETLPSWNTGTVNTWLKDETRKPGDTALIEGEGQYEGVFFVAMFLDYSRDNSNTRDVMHIMFEHGEDSQAALDTAKEVYGQWLAGEATVDSFSTLAAEHSHDRGAAETGGLYQYVYKGQMIAGFDDWLFDEARAPGDSDIVESDYGYHIMLYVSDNLPVWIVEADSQLRWQDFNSYVEALANQYSVHYIWQDK